MSWHRDNADQSQRAADNLAGNGGAGSIEHFNLALDAQRSRDQAAWDEALHRSLPTRAHRISSPALLLALAWDRAASAAALPARCLGRCSKRC